MKKEIKFSLVFRDMWQSAGKYVPRVDQLVKVAPAIVEMGCFARVETNGGGFEQVNLLFGENPNKAVREWTKPFHEAGIQTHMLDRALNGLRMSPVPADVRKLFYKVKKAQGTDITRTFCGLNDIRNIAPSITLCARGGNDFAVFALYHPFAYPYCGILYRYGIEAYQAGCRRNLYQGYGRYRPSGIFRQDCGKHQGCSSGHSHPVSQPCGTRFQHGKHPCGL